MLKMSHEQKLPPPYAPKQGNVNWRSEARLIGCSLANIKLAASPRTLLLIECVGWGFLFVKANDSPETPTLRRFLKPGRHQIKLEVARAQSYTANFRNYCGKDSLTIQVPQTNRRLEREAFRIPAPKAIRTKLALPALIINEPSIKLGLSRSHLSAALKNIRLTIRNLNISSIHLPKFGFAIPQFRVKTRQIQPVILRAGLRPQLPKSMIEIRDSDLHHS
jgi:hypothetical protein